MSLDFKLAELFGDDLFQIFTAIGVMNTIVYLRNYFSPKKNYRDD